MNPLRHHPNQTITNKKVLDDLFAKWYSKRAEIYDTLPVVDVRLGAKVRINWACAWNKVSNIGKTGGIIATNGQLCIVQITSGKKEGRILDVYRCEDVDDIAKETTELKATEDLLRSIGLPTFKL